MANNVRYPILPAGDPGTGPLMSTVDDGTAHHAASRISGEVSAAAVTGNITTATTVVGGATDYGHLGTVNVGLSGTHAGVNVIFEASRDAGTTWSPIVGQREDTSTAESASGLITSNATRSWRFPLAGANRFRVRATAWTSGSAAVSMVAYPTPVVPIVAAVYGPPPGRTQKIVILETEPTIQADTAIGALQRIDSAGTAPVTAQTSIPVAAGKTFRITSLSFFLHVTTATTPPACRMRLRFNPSGAMVVGSPMVGSWVVPIPLGTTVIGMAMPMSTVALPPEGIEMSASAAAAGGFGFSKSTLTATTPTNSAISMMLVGYEYG